VATLRSRAIRIALFARLILHPPAGTDTVLLDQYREVLNAQVAEMQEVRAILEGQRAGTMPQWIAGIAKAHASDVARISDLVDISQAIADALAGDKSEVESLLAEHFKRGRGGFFESVTSICNALWADVDAERQAALARTAADAAHISATLARMERIGKHVRLVALNASVEAARAGDAGKGLGVIAHEFKSLAEEIQRLAITARSHADTAPD
ncbi:MAG: methyl-accepting chemotaxis protein, partial [Pseudomonadota bacterium]